MMKFVTNDEALRHLLQALNETNYGKRRGALRAAAMVALQAVRDDAWAKRVVESCPMVRLKHVTPRPTLAGLRDNLCETALANIAAYGDAAISKVEDALKEPTTWGVTAPKSKSGFAFGQHRDFDKPDSLRMALYKRLGDDEPKTKGEHVEETKEIHIDISEWKLEALVRTAFRVAAKLGDPDKRPFWVMRQAKAFCTDSKSASRFESVATYIETLDEREREKFEKEVAEYKDSAEVIKLRDALIEALGGSKIEGTKADVVVADGYEPMTLPESEKLMLVDMAMKAAGLGELRSYVEEVNKARKAAAEALSTVEELRKVAAMPASVGGSSVVEADGTVPNGKMVMVPAWKAFDLERGKDTFKFEVPTWDWDGHHPHVPAIDKDYIFRPHELFRALYGLVMNKPTYLHGHTGTGKTTLIEQMAARLRYPFFRINFDSEITRLDLIGRDTLVNEGGITVSKFVDGVIPHYMRQPYIMGFDEIDFVRSDVGYVMQRVLENDALVLTEDGGRVVKPHPMMRLFATGNTVGQGDEHGMYQGARLQSMALLDRFTNWIEVDYLESADRTKLIRKAAPTLDATTVNRIGQYVTEHLEAFKTSKVLQPLSPRGYMSLAESIATFSAYYPASSRTLAVKEALGASILDRASQQDRAVLKGIVDRVFGV